MLKSELFLLWIPGVWSNQESGSFGVKSGIIAFLTRVLFEIYVNISLYFYGVVNSRNKGKYLDTRKEFQPLPLKHQPERLGQRSNRGEVKPGNSLGTDTLQSYHHYTVKNSFLYFPIFKRDFQTNEKYWLSSEIISSFVERGYEVLLFSLLYRCFKMSIMGTYSYLNILKMPNSKHREFYLQLNWLC